MTGFLILRKAEFDDVNQSMHKSEHNMLTREAWLKHWQMAVAQSLEGLRESTVEG